MQETYATQIRQVTSPCHLAQPQEDGTCNGCLLCRCYYKPGRFASYLQVLHADAEEVAETHLSDVVGDVLVVLEVSPIDVSVAWGDLDIRLAVC